MGANAVLQEMTANLQLLIAPQDASLLTMIIEEN